ncbi:MAG: prolyl oligopeptidase family serine peptidase [Archangium sp.]
MSRFAALALVLCACGPQRAPIDEKVTCTASDTEVSCAPRISQVMVNGVGRDVYWQEPTSDAPTAGRPLVIVFQGSWFGPTSTWGTVKTDLAFGGFHQARLQVMLLEHGFTVLAPSAVAGVAWQTNLVGVSWDSSTDKPMMAALLQDIRDGKYGPVDTSRLYATGISSGGYMTSRMAASEAGTFRALAIQSGSWCTCAGVACVLPDTLPADHPPTRFLHGRTDAVVPIGTAETYLQKLSDQGTEADMIVDENTGHAWFADSPARITEWFEGH